MSRPNKLLSLLAGTILLIIVVVGAVVIANKTSSGDGQTKACSGKHDTHVVSIHNSKVIPSHITAPQCDILTIMNFDDTQREIAFGLHEHHTPYDGIAERLVGKDQSVSVTLVQTGNFRFHDHIHDEVQGTFTVAPN